MAALTAACGNNPQNQTIQNADTAAIQSDRVEVLSFHGKKRCPTCVAIEQLTRQVVETEFAAQLADGSVVFRIVDIDKEEALSDKYQVTWSSLYIVKHRNDSETAEDLTRFAFANARNKPDTFKEGVKNKISTLLK